MGYGKSVQDALREPARELRKAIPEVYQGFAQLHEASLAPGALYGNTKS